MAKLPTSASPEITPSRMFFAARSVPPGNVWTFTLPPVRFSTSFAQCSIWTHGNGADRGRHRQHHPQEERRSDKQGLHRVHSGSPWTTPNAGRGSTWEETGT